MCLLAVIRPPALGKANSGMDSRAPMLVVCDGKTWVGDALKTDEATTTIRLRQGATRVPQNSYPPASLGSRQATPPTSEHPMSLASILVREVS